MSDNGAIQPCQTPLKKPEGCRLEASVGFGMQALRSPNVRMRISARTTNLCLFIESLLEGLKETHFFILFHIIMAEPLAIHGNIDPWIQCLDIGQSGPHVEQSI